MLLLWLVVGRPQYVSGTLVAAIAALLGGIVLWGSNRSTANEATAQLAAVEARRAELIGLIELRVIPD
jgi:hypothetical protein